MFKLKDFPGIAVCFVIAVISYFLGKLAPVIGGAVFGITIGMIIAGIRRPVIFEFGIRYTSKKLLQLSIILIGFEMNLYSVLKTGADSIYVMIFTLITAFLIAYIVGKYLKIDSKVATLIGVGTAICGGSAIAAAAPVIDADDKEIAYSISTIFLFNVAAVFIFPALGHLLRMSNEGFGIWAGTAINDTSSVVAAAFSYSDVSGKLATIVKLTRTLFIIPITLVLAIYYAKKITSSKTTRNELETAYGEVENPKQESGFSFVKIFPWFVIGFLAAAIINTTGILDAGISAFLGKTGKFMIIMAMTAIGLNTNIKKLIANGTKPIVLGLCCWMSIAVVSIIVQRFMNQM